MSTSSPLRSLVAIITLSVIILPALHAAAFDLAGGPTEAERLRGIVTVIWGDPAPTDPRPPTKRFFFSADSGADGELLLSPDQIENAGGARALDGRKVEILIERGSFPSTLQADNSKIRVVSLRALPMSPAAKVTKAVTGPQPWISILCKFSDISAEPKSLSYFQNMYSSSYPGLDHYWRDLSYNIANVNGSTAVHWVTLPHPQSYYEASDSSRLSAMFNDCTAAANSMVYFPDFVGINMMFNGSFGPYAWGGSRYASLDGVSRRYRVTWEPPWGYEDIAVIAHEMGHGFGLPHSNNADGDSNPYDNPWDVMSDSWHYAIFDSTYETLGKHTIGYHKDMLGWIASANKLDISSTGIYTVMIDHLALQSTTNLRLVNIQIPSSSREYTVEVRDRVGYDGNLPGFAVILHEINSSREEPAWLIDPVSPTNGADEGAMWRVGECFEDTPNQISVCVQSVTTNGFQVRISYGDTGEIFSDGFEAGSSSGWSTTVP